MILLEPPQDPFGPRDSDYATLTVEGNVVTVFFASDGAADFANKFPPAGTPSVLETGLPQHMFPGISLLDVTVTSDFNTPEAPDSASTMGCLGLALTALIGFGGRVRLRRQGK
jgi:hypothetical protein